MKLSEEMLMAYVDGELDAAATATVEEAMRTDPDVAAAVARARTLRERIRQAYAPIVYEPVPARLLAAINGSAQAQVDTDADADAAGTVVPLRTSRPSQATHGRSWRWPQWAAVAASLALGIWIGPWLRDSGPSSMMKLSAGVPLAGGELAQALETRLAADGTANGRVQVGLSFRASDSRYCRTFALASPQSIAGLACRDADGWRISALTEATPAQGELRLASTALPPSILAEVDARLLGEPLDADGERMAREAGWR